MPIRNKPFPDKPETENSSYRGPERRGRGAENGKSGEAIFDERGNSVWKTRTQPRRRSNDDTATLMAPLDVDFLSILDDGVVADGYDPYSRDDKADP